MNLKHGFYSTNTAINPDCRLLQVGVLSSDDLVLAERFLHGDSVKNPEVAQAIVKSIFESGRFKYPSIYPKCESYMNHEYCYALERLYEQNN